MGFSSQLTDVLLQCPFGDREKYCLHTEQCQALCMYFSSNLERLFGTIMRPPPLDSTISFKASRGWNSFSVFYDRTFLKLLSGKKEHKSSSATFSDGHCIATILGELRATPYVIEELYRVVKEAERYLNVCNNPEWWKTALTIGVMTEVRDVHFHDLMWCLAGVNLALQAARGVELESRAQFTRLDIAKCCAEMIVFSSQDSELIRCEENDQTDLLSRLQVIRRKYNEMNFVRKKVMNSPEKLKHETVHFMLQKLGVPSRTAESDTTSFYTRKPPQNMQISSQDISFSSRPRVIALGNSAVVYEASWLGMKVAAKQFDYCTHRESFNFEASVLVSAQSPFVVQFYGWSVNTNQYTAFLVLELIESNLATLVKERMSLNKPLRLPVAMDLMLQLSRAMEYLHSKNITHGDLKPSNVLYEPLQSSKELMEKGYGRVKLSNFGAGRLSLEKSQTVTLGYRAPELLAQQDRNRMQKVENSFESDVYSFAMTFAYILTGKEPFSAIQCKNTIRDMLLTGTRPELPTNCPSPLKELLCKCWSMDPSVCPSFTHITMTLRHLKLLFMKMRNLERPEPLLDKEFFLSTPMIAYTDLCQATNNFSEVVELITMYSMYYGVLSDGTKILAHRIGDASNIKKIWLKTSRLLRLRHSNIAGFRAICINSSQIWFIYEQNSVRGSLDKWLDNDTLQEPLDVSDCFRIALGTACGLQYLHAQDGTFAVGVDNILIDDQYEPRILIDSSVHDDKGHDPEYQQRLDMLHFGLFLRKLLDYICQRRNIHTNFRGNIHTNFHDYQISMLQRVEQLCQDNNIKIDEVVELLEMEYDMYSDDDGGEFSDRFHDLNSREMSTITFNSDSVY